MPLEYMLRVMWSCAETDPDRADRMAIAAAPYMHVKKKGTTVSDGLVVQITPFDWAKRQQPDLKTIKINQI